MPGLEVSGLKQRAVYWPATGIDEHGQVTVGSPVEIKVRWVQKRREIITNQGNAVGLDATVTVDRRIPIGSWMWLGKLSEWNTSGSSPGIRDEELMEVKLYEETPDVKGRKVYRTVGLMRLHEYGPQ